MINQNSSIKEQWLDFLTNCSEHDGDPENINRIIKQGYEIMKMANWTNEQVLAYDMSQYTEMCEKKSLEKKLADQLKKGIRQGKEEGIRQSEIKQIKNLLDLGVERSKIVSFLEIVTEEEFDYICQHKNDNILDILKFLDKKRS